MNSHLERRFSKYLANLMTKDERTSFENELASDNELKNEFEEYQIGMVAGKRIRYLELNDKVSQIIAEEDSKNENLNNGGARVVNFNLRMFISSVAAIMVLVLVATIYIPTTQKSGDTIHSNNTFASNFGQIRGNSKDPIDIARRLYEVGNYDSVSIVIDQMPQIQRNQATVQRLLGLNHMAKNDITSAIDAFKTSIEEPESKDHLEAYWNLGWIYTQSEQYDSTSKYLEKIIDSDYKSDYKKPAKKLLKEVKWQMFIQNWFGWYFD